LVPIWGSKEFLRFVIVVNSFSGLASFLLMVLLYMFLGDPELWFTSTLTGFSASLAGFTVAIKQLNPEQEIKLFGFTFPLRAKSLPVTVMLVNLVCYFLHAPFGSFRESILFLFFGMYISWLYLRFFQVKADIIGDMNEAFSFASFFPDTLKPPMIILSNIVHSLCCCFRFASASVLPGINGGPFVIPTEGVDLDAERRRARALRALDQRLQLQDFHLNQAALADISTSPSGPKIELQV